MRESASCQDDRGRQDRRCNRAINTSRRKASGPLRPEKRGNLTRYTYQKYEKGESRPGNPANPTLRTLIAMAQVLAVSVDELIPDAPPDLRAR